MNDDTIQDLKQFISAELHQQTSDIRGDISKMREDISDIRGDISKMRREIKSMDQKITDLSDSVAEAIDRSNSESQR